MMRHDPLLDWIDHFGLALEARYDPVDRVFEIARLDTALACARGSQRRLIHQVGEVRPDEAWGSRRYRGKVDTWITTDAKGQVLGRVAVKAANLLRGKEKTVFTPHVDTGDFVIVINAEKVRLTGKKEEQKSYMSFSGYVGGHKSESARARRARHPELLIERAVRGMIPHNRLGRHAYRKLKVYRGESHPHTAQQPEAVKL